MELYKNPNDVISNDYIVNYPVKIPALYYISWNIISYEKKDCTFSLYDSFTSYFTEQTNGTPYPYMGSGDTQVVGINLMFSIQMANRNDVDQLKYRKTSFSLTDSDGKPIGKIITMTFNKIDTEDRNSICLNIASWKSAGLT